MESGLRVQGGEGCDEASFPFDPADAEAVAWFIRALGIKRKRQVSEAQRERLAALSRQHGFQRSRLSQDPALAHQ